MTIRTTLQIVFSERDSMEVTRLAELEKVVEVANHECEQIVVRVDSEQQKEQEARTSMTQAAESYDRRLSAWAVNGTHEEALAEARESADRLKGLHATQSAKLAALRAEKERRVSHLQKATNALHEAQQHAKQNRREVLEHEFLAAIVDAANLVDRIMTVEGIAMHATRRFEFLRDNFGDRSPKFEREFARLIYADAPIESFEKSERVEVIDAQ
jgi:chromosome segregation ATPase